MEQRFDMQLDQIQDETNLNMHQKYCGRCGNALSANAYGFYCGICHISYQYRGSGKGFKEIADELPKLCILTDEHGLKIC